MATTIGWLVSLSWVLSWVLMLHAEARVNKLSSVPVP